MDLPRFLDNLLQSSGIHSGELKEKAQELKKAVEEMTVKEFHHKEIPADGLSISNMYSVYNDSFLGSTLARDTAWYQALSMALPRPLGAAYAALIRAKHSLTHLFSRK
jgi:hypothetical protein